MACSCCSYLFFRARWVQFQPQMIARCVGEVLPDSQVTLCGLDRGMAEGHLYLFQLRPALVRQPGICASKIVWRQARQSELSCILPQKKNQIHFPVRDSWVSRPPRFTGLNTLLTSIPEAALHSSMASFAQAGIGTERIRPCFPKR